MCIECEKILQSKRNLDQHVLKVHRICKTCGEEFKSKVDLDQHKICHTTCAHVRGISVPSINLIDICLLTKLKTLSVL